MALTSHDETDLLLPLYAGIHESPHFGAFLRTLQRRTRAAYVGLSTRLGDDPTALPVHYQVGRDLPHEARLLPASDFLMPEPQQFQRLRPGRVYAMAEFGDLDPADAGARTRAAAVLGIADCRVVRLAETGAMNAWLMLAREHQCSAADSALLSSLAPFVAQALRSLMLIEQQRAESALSAIGMARSGAGWIAFDGEARVIGIASATGTTLAALLGAAPRIGERLRDLGPRPERQLSAAAAAFADDPQAAPRPIVLSPSPRIEALLAAPHAIDMAPVATITARAAMVALCRLPRPPAPGRVERLAGLRDLPLREAELALALADGRTLAEAAAAMGLTLETVRNYSKRLYAKLGVRGQPGLVRAVCESSALLA